MKVLISVIIPVFNEEKVVRDCLESLKDQTYKPLEIILVDDGSTDKTIDVIKNCQLPAHQSLGVGGSIVNCQLLRQQHRGPGPARNLGAKKAKGDILVFVDADMTFDEDFIRDLAKPITDGKTIGTFSKNELVANPNDLWSICWNINRNVPKDRMLPKDYPDTAPVFRAILKSEFDKVRGFDATGEYTDDWSLSQKLKKRSTLASGATYYHSNPSTLKEVYKQARWIGKNDFISGTFIRKIRSLIQYSLPTSALIGLFKSALNQRPNFIIFKIWYDLAVWISVTKSFFGERKSK